MGVSFCKPGGGVLLVVFWLSFGGVSVVGVNGICVLGLVGKGG